MESTDFIKLKALAEADEEANRAFGSVFGAFIGDAAGGVLEFRPPPTKQEVLDSLKFQGGGYMRLAPGQITDDSEMAMCILQGLTDTESSIDESKVPKVLNMDGICYYYWNWSINAFDIGYATSRAFQSLWGCNSKDHLMTYRVFLSTDETSQSNGSLMRLTPQIVWAKNLSDHEFESAMKTQALFTHNNPVVFESNYLYGYAIRYLIKNGGSAEAAYEAVRDECFKRKENGTAFVSLTEWFEDIENGKLPDILVKKGWLKIAFMYSFHYLREAKGKELNSELYDTVMEDILLHGGDVDTNAAIVGGLIGALVGFKNIPQEYVSGIMKFNPLTERDNMMSHMRPDFVIASRHLSRILMQVYENAPETLKIQCNRRMIEGEDIDEFLQAPIKFLKKKSVNNSDQVNNSDSGILKFSATPDLSNMITRRMIQQQQSGAIALNHPMMPPTFMPMFNHRFRKIKGTYTKLALSSAFALSLWYSYSNKK